MSIVGVNPLKWNRLDRQVIVLCYHLFLLFLYVAAIAPVSATVYFTDGSEQNITFNGRYWYFDNFHGSSVDFYDHNY